MGSLIRLFVAVAIRVVRPARVWSERLFGNGDPPVQKPRPGAPHGNATPDGATLFTARQQLCGTRTTANRVGQRHVIELNVGVDRAQQQTTAAHIASSGKVARYDEPSP